MKRRTLRDRETQDIARAGPDQPIERPTGQAEAVEAVDVTGEAAAPTAPVPHEVGSGGKRLGLYFQRAEFDAAKAAYLSDWQHGGEADTFPRWITAVLEEHADRTPTQRAQLARTQERAQTRGIARSFEINADTLRRVKESIVADQDAGRWSSTNAWAGDAIAAAVARARSRGRLPTPPARLPHRLTR